ncbi:MAG: family 16 glycoside hydrolase [Phycisphaerales bacterium]
MPLARRLAHVLVLVLAAATSAHARQEVIRPFDGATLDGWNGDRGTWSVEDGAIVGRSTAERPLAASSYLAWDGDMPGDFRLRCEFLVTGGNSGIQYRSARVDGQADMAGFQADLDAANAYTGILYEGLGRGIMSARGERAEWTPEGKRVAGTFAEDAALKDVMRPGEWNEYVVEAHGTRVRHWINGTLMTDVVDGDATRFRRDGQLAFQLHQGPPMEARFRAIEVTPIREAPPAEAITAPAGFEVARVASAQPGQGSWVAIAFDPRGRAIVSPQSGPLMRLEIPGLSDGFEGAEVRTTVLDEVPGSAQGLCFVGEDLWVNASAAGPEAGLWRLRDGDGDGRFDARTKVLTWDGDGGEHGPHGVVPGPDGALYVAVGNHTPVPASVERAACDRWAEDIVGERMWDPRGHAVGLTAPGGTVIRVDPVTGDAELWATGFRNHYDLAFAPDGELFTYDSDMEWDMGAPWYRAPRIVHVVRGGEYGWRSGSGKWPAWSPDSMPAACDTDAASPTGMLHGADGAFPPPWDRMLYAADWTYGRILAVDLRATEGSFVGAWQPFVTGRPMPVADMAWGPDGAMWIVTGGRGTQSGLYRVAAADGARGADAGAGAASAATTRPAPDDRASRAIAAKASLRQAFEELMARPGGTAAMPAIVRALGSDDRAVAFAARVALEHRGPDAIAVAMTDGSPRVRAMALLAAARSDGIAPERVFDGVLGDDAFAGADPWTRIIALRALGVSVSRHREAGRANADRIAAFLAPGFADVDPRIAESALVRACALRRPEALEPTLRRMEHARTRAEALRWATMLRAVDAGWTDAQRARLWTALDRLDDQAGGFSLGGFIARIREDASKAVGRPAAAANGDAPDAAPDPSASPTPAPSPVVLRTWTVDELATALPEDGEARDLARGARVFAETTCVRCHRFDGQGGATGPDLTGVGGRFTRRDLLRAILEPSADVSDQYRDSAIVRTDGDTVIGRIVGQDAESITVGVDPYGPATVRIPRADVASIEPVPTSSMPGGLLGARTRAEILDLLAYLEAGGRGG